MSGRARSPRDGTALPLQHLSKITGAIYDCTIDPDRWPNVMAEISRILDCVDSVMLIHDLRGLPPTFLYTWNTDKNWVERYREYAGEVAALFKDLPDMPLDEPLIFSQYVDERRLTDQRVYREWAAPQGYCDFIQTITLRSPDRIGAFSAQRHNSVGACGEREAEIMRLLAPHIRRAVTIGDLMDIGKIEARAFASTLDKLAMAVVVVAEGGRILHANQTAEAMFREGGPVCSVGGKLSARDPAGAQELGTAIALAPNNETAIGATGIGVPLRSSTGQPALAHVLPLAHGELRTRLVPQAVAAVFVSQTQHRSPVDLDLVATIYGLTPAEVRLLDQMTPSSSLVEAATRLGISEPTARTHLTRIMAKTGTSRQADLFSLLAGLTPPLRRS